MSQPHAFAQHRYRIAPIGRHRQHHTRNITKHGQRIVIVEVPAKALLVRQPGNPHDHRIGELPVRKERKRRRLAPDLVLGIVDIGEELDLRQRQQPVVRRADRQPQDRLLVQQGIDHPRRTEPRMQLLRGSIDPTLRPHILPANNRARILQQHVRQRPADQLGHMLRLFHRARIVGEKRAPRLGRRQRTRNANALGRHNTRHHRRGIGQLGPRNRQFHLPLQRRLDRIIFGAHLGGAHHAFLDQQGGARQQRIALFLGPHLVLGAIGKLHVVPGMAIEPHRLHMQEHRLPLPPRHALGLTRRAHGID